MLAILAVLAVRQLRKVAPLRRPLTLDRGGRGRHEDLYNTTIDDIASAFARYTTVATSADGA